LKSASNSRHASEQGGALAAILVAYGNLVKTVTMKRWGVILLLAWTGACAAGSARPHLYITTEHSPPSAMLEDKRVTGFAAEKIRVLLDRAGIDYEMELLPWRRAYQMAERQHDTCVFSTTRVPAREHVFKWVGPTHEGDWTLFGLASRDYHLKTLEDARGLRIGAYNGDVRGEYLQQQGYLVDMVQDKVSNARKLLLGRVDLWATSVRTGSAIVEENGWKGLLVPVLTFKHTELYLACNAHVPDPLIHKMNETLQAMNREGVSAAIERRFNGPANR
jgi:polar amino acid transport system substrate-binding protein